MVRVSKVVCHKEIYILVPLKHQQYIMVPGYQPHQSDILHWQGVLSTFVWLMNNIGANFCFCCWGPRVWGLTPVWSRAKPLVWVRGPSPPKRGSGDPEQSPWRLTNVANERKPRLAPALVFYKYSRSVGLVWRSAAANLHSSDEPDELSKWLQSWWQHPTINIVPCIIIIILFFKPSKKRVGKK